MRTLVLGASGMLGSAVFRMLNEKQDWEVFGTLRSPGAKKFFPSASADRLLMISDIQNYDALAAMFARIRPDVVINCISVAKELMKAADPLVMIPIYALLPHRLAAICSLIGSRLVHISTDDVFSGTKGGYTEDDPADPKDLYGMSKLLGEVRERHTITLRTSMIGHELQSAGGLLGWFLSREERCSGFSRAIFSGLPTVVLARIIRDVVIPRPDLFGPYHLGASPISKFELLRLVAKVYGKTIDIVPDDSITIDRSLNTDRFRAATGYVAPEWPELITIMRIDWENRVNALKAN